jgi:septal ring factor EnvC (AmiA/AmiB activator)
VRSQFGKLVVVTVILVMSAAAGAQRPLSPQPVLDKRAELAAAEREVTDLNNQVNVIGQDQQRVRQNLQVLKGSAEEKALVKRYTTELDRQEDRLVTIRTQLADATTRRDARRAELSQLIQRLTFALDAPATP